MNDRKFALNTSTLFPFELDVLEQIKVSAEAGYDGIELWMKDILHYLEAGGTPEAIKDYLEEHEVALVNAITFFKWSDSNEEIRKAGLQQAEEEMSILKRLGCRAVAAPPTGDVVNVSLEAMAKNFAQLTQIAENNGIEVYLEFWGMADTLSTLSEAMYVAMESGLPDVKILVDFFHMYTGASSLESLDYVKRQHVGIIHVNDYPATPSRETITDSDRVFPGDGLLPTEKITDYLTAIQYDGYLSLELFIENYGEQTAAEVASHGLEKMKAAYAN